MDETAANQQVATRLRDELQQSAQQEERLKVALIRVLKLIDDATPPR
jgi:hypothetical protein